MRPVMAQLFSVSVVNRKGVPKYKLLAYKSFKKCFNKQIAIKRDIYYLYIFENEC